MCGACGQYGGRTRAPRAGSAGRREQRLPAVPPARACALPPQRMGCAPPPQPTARAAAGERRGAAARQLGGRACSRMNAIFSVLAIAPNVSCRVGWGWRCASMSAQAWAGGRLRLAATAAHVRAAASATGGPAAAARAACRPCMPPLPVVRPPPLSRHHSPRAPPASCPPPPGSSRPPPGSPPAAASGARARSRQISIGRHGAGRARASAVPHGL